MELDQNQRTGMLRSMVSRSVKRFRACMTDDKVVINIVDTDNFSVIVLSSLTRMFTGLALTI